MTWTNTGTDELLASAQYRLESAGEAGLIFRLSYTVTIRDEKVSVDEPIRLTTTRPHFGGVRWWFVCSLIVNGRACRRRCGKLYLPPGGRYFGCRVCYGLTYKSAQDAHKYDRIWRLVGDDVNRLFDLATGRLKL